MRCLKIAQGPYSFWTHYMLIAGLDKIDSEDDKIPEGETADLSIGDHNQELDVTRLQSIHDFCAQVWDDTLRPSPWPEHISYLDLQRSRDSLEWYE